MLQETEVHEKELHSSRKTKMETAKNNVRASIVDVRGAVYASFAQNKLIRSWYFYVTMDAKWWIWIMCAAAFYESVIMHKECQTMNSLSRFNASVCLLLHGFRLHHFLYKAAQIISNLRTHNATKHWTHSFVGMQDRRMGVLATMVWLSWIFLSAEPIEVTATSQRQKWIYCWPEKHTNIWLMVLQAPCICSITHHVQLTMLVSHPTICTATTSFI